MTLLRLSREDVLEIASAHRTLALTLIYASFIHVLNYLVFISSIGAAIGFSTETDNYWPGIFYLLTVIPQFAAVGKYYSATKMNWINQIWIGLELVPCISLFVLAAAYVAASRQLKLCGLSVGWFGVASAELAAFQRVKMRCQACGENVDAEETVCPMCGKVLAAESQ